jgi:putative NADPH-quinone reductase
MSDVSRGRIAIIQGHPDRRGKHFCHALADAYAEGAGQSGYRVSRIEVAQLEFPLLHTKEDWESAPPPEAIRAAQAAIAEAEHLVIVYPLWLGSMPALLKGFFEQALRPGFAIGTVQGGNRWAKLLGGRSARIVVTMGMPAFVYRWFFGAHSLKSLERNILRFCGIRPIRETLVGSVEGCSAGKRAAWLAELAALGRQGA